MKPVQPSLLPTSLADWDMSSLTLVGLRCLVARRSVITLVFKELESGDWYVTKMRGGKILGERKFASCPRLIHPYIDRNARRRTAA